MKKLIVRQYIADAFTDTVFKGNPAAICLLQNWISDEIACQRQHLLSKKIRIMNLDGSHRAAK